MNVVIKVIGTIIVCVGLFYIIKPEVMKWFMAFFTKGKRLYLAALVRFALAITFFLGARECHIPWLIAIFGLIFLLSGLLIFMLGLEKAKGIINRFQEQPGFMFRVVSSIVLCVGFVIVFAA